MPYSGLFEPLSDDKTVAGSDTDSEDSEMERTRAEARRAEQKRSQELMAKVPELEVQWEPVSSLECKHVRI